MASENARRLLFISGGGSRIRTREPFGQRFSRPPPSTTRPSLQIVNHPLENFLKSDSFQTSHIRTQGFGDDNAAVRLLIIFHDCHNGAAYSQPRTVQRVYKFYLTVVFP